MNTPTSDRPSGSKWTVTALLMMGMALFMSRGGAASLLPLIRAFIPVIVAVVLYRIVRGFVRSQILGQQPRPGGHAGSNQGQQQGQVIDLCPRCGSLLAPGHRCT